MHIVYLNVKRKIWGNFPPTPPPIFDKPVDNKRNNTYTHFCKNKIPAI